MMKELHSYQTEADRENVKTDNMKNSHADPFDIKQQENIRSMLLRAPQISFFVSVFKSTSMPEQDTEH